VNATEELASESDIEERINYGHWGEAFSGNFDTADRTLIDTPEMLRAFLPVLLQLKLSTREAPELALDSEGWNLDMYGTLTILQMRVRSLKHTYVFDVLALGGKKMFETEGEQGQSLKKALESKKHIQLWWDIRQDTEALFHHYGILIGSRIDVQLMELAVRNHWQRNWLKALAGAVWNHGYNWMDSG
jgi:exonuclease 3'-5' domain-containing protein 1